MTGIELIAAERKRQIEEEGWTAVHDDDYSPNGELSKAAMCYAMPPEERHPIFIIQHWPWRLKWYKPVKRSRIRELEKAGALIAAEIDRLLRKEERKMNQMPDIVEAYNMSGTVFYDTAANMEDRRMKQPFLSWIHDFVYSLTKPLAHLLIKDCRGCPLKVNPLYCKGCD
jgi:hypothetical protein